LEKADVQTNESPAALGLGIGIPGAGISTRIDVRQRRNGPPKKSFSLLFTLISGKRGKLDARGRYCRGGSLGLGFACRQCHIAFCAQTST